MGTRGDRRPASRVGVASGDGRGGDDGDHGPVDRDGPHVDGAEHLESAANTLSLDGVSIAGITRRRVAFVLAAALTLWIVAVFARQVGDATAASVRADRMRTANATLSTQVASLERERELIQRQAYVELAAREYGLGTAKEREFSLAADAPPLPSNAPGSAALRLGSQHDVRSPLDSWLTLLFGPAPNS